MQIREVFFLPPLAIARLGGSDTPLDSFVWGRDPTIHGAHQTVIRAAASLQVLADGTLRAYLPGSIQFRDGDLLRPVAPFFELWVQPEGGDPRPLTPQCLQEIDRTATLDNVEYVITVANRKAQRRTGSATCAYLAREVVPGDDHQRRQLLAFSPHTSGEKPLVFKDHPIPLGYFQVIKPLEREALGINLFTLRVRFTPAQGHVYGPPTAIAAPASPLPPGIALSPRTLGGRMYEIVAEKNRILNPHSVWSRYTLSLDGGNDPQPSDSYDGANVGNNRSWGVVDDTCDGIIEARVSLNNKRYLAYARVFSSCPDFAPDRRPFYSVADDLADRDDVPHAEADGTRQETEAEIADLFDRAFETASLFNLDSMRERAITENVTTASVQGYRSPPHVDGRSMTRADRGYAVATGDLPETSMPDLPLLPYAETAQFAHSSLCDIETLIALLKSDADYVKRLIRPPFGRFQDLPRKPGGHKGRPRFRDPRVPRDTLHDMRMPPYLRDSDQNPLSITYRQYRILMGFIDELNRRPDSPVSRRIAEAARRVRQVSVEAKAAGNAEKGDIYQRRNHNPPGKKRRKHNRKHK